MARQLTPSWVSPRVAPGARRSGLVALLGAIGAILVILLILGVAPAAEASWGMFPRRPPEPRAAPPDQSWLVDPPERPGAHSKGKIAVFVFKGDDVYQPVRAAVVRVLRRKRLVVTTTLRPLDSAAQYRELSTTVGLAVFVEGEVTGEGARQSALLRLTSGLSGRRIASARFTGPTPAIVGAVEKTLWTRLGPTIQRACSGASRPRRHEREPLRIDAGDPLETAPTPPDAVD
jgi:hypothetical protein